MVDPAPGRGRYGVRMPIEKNDSQLLSELAPVVDENLTRHIAEADGWQPHDLVPWDQGKNFAFMGGTDWSADQSTLSDVEALEMKVLGGLRETLRRARPILFVEVDFANEAAVRAFLDDAAYEIVETLPATGNTNYLCRPLAAGA